MRECVIQVTPRQDHYDGICYMMWCGQTTFGRIITSHPALEGTFCAPSKWCELGRCVPWPGSKASPTQQVPTVCNIYCFYHKSLSAEFQKVLLTRTCAVRIRQSSYSDKYLWMFQRVDGQWSLWSSVSCSSCSCPSLAGAIGLTIQKRTCSNPYPSNGGLECVGATSRAIVCNQHCSRPLKTVDEYIGEKCTEHKRLKNDHELTGTGSQLNRYPQRACKVFCDVSSTYGSQRNYRFFGDNLPNGAPCGNGRYCLEGECLVLSCNENALVTRDVACPSERCSSNSVTFTNATGRWTDWSSWTFCSQSCGNGFRERTRWCLNGHCDGDSTERTVCFSSPCPTPSSNSDDSWSEWTSWNQCSVTCDKGSQARYRRCISSSHTSLGTSCPGNSMEIRPCDMGSCNLGTVGLWGHWTEWTICSTSCGPGIQTRNRFCTKEPCDGSAQSRMSCNLGECATPSHWSQWESWSECSKLCGRGLRSRTRKCPDKNCFGGRIEQQFCNEQPCISTSGQWSGWSGWGSCSVSCGSGIRRRTRHCQYGNCDGSHKDSATCNQGPCGETDATWGGKQQNSSDDKLTLIDKSSVPYNQETTPVTAAESTTETSTHPSIHPPAFTVNLTETTTMSQHTTVLHNYTLFEDNLTDITTQLTTFSTPTLKPDLIDSSSTITLATKPIPVNNENQFQPPKKKIRRFWMFANGTLSSQHEIDPVILESFVKQAETALTNAISARTNETDSVSTEITSKTVIVGVIGRRAQRHAGTEYANEFGNVMVQECVLAMNMNERLVAYGFASFDRCAFVRRGSYSSISLGE
ncbi:unnamed protein product [Anisakis simplex]|uniref:ADAMTS-like protease (inferred by orthology to a C. elegans protein) n=1 Tax=Anisakis simplex TaxID=6269 RepID=A0A0M3K300_ANISI|nr:unnamed protein product [Anisakis simplex]